MKQTSELGRRDSAGLLLYGRCKKWIVTEGDGRDTPEHGPCERRAGLFRELPTLIRLRWRP